MGALLLHILFVSVGAVIGGAAGWYLRAASPQKLIETEPLPLEVMEELCAVPEQENSFDHMNTLISRLHQLTASVAADVGEHNIRVQAINDELSNGGDVVSVIERLMTANAQMQSQLQAAEQRMQQQSREIESHCKEARTDALTKLANRRAFDDEMRRCMEAYHSKNQPSCVMMVDVDHFKKFNDTYGHQAGDEVLRNVARILRREASSEEIVCRYGGEEFAVIYPGLKASQAVPRAEKARAAIAAEVLEFQGMDLRVTASGGVAEISGHETADELVKRADVALYVCKENGRNCGYWHDGSTSKPMKGAEAAPAPAEPKVEGPPPPAAAGEADKAEPAAVKKAPVTPPAPAPAVPTTPPAEDSANTQDVAETEPEDRVFQFMEEPSTPKIQRRDRVAGLSDYSTFCRDVDRRLAEFKRDGGTVSLLVVSVDDCRQLGESYGSSAVDVALRNTAQAVKATRREMDHAARCNDHIFALLLPGALSVEAKSIADRIRQDVQSNPLLINGMQVRYTVSAGITELHPEDEREVAIQRAIESLNAAQKAGGNRSLISLAKTGSSAETVAAK